MAAHEYKPECFCDDCIKTRVRQKVAQREADALSKAYVQRRGGAIGTIGVPEALKDDKR